MAVAYNVCILSLPDVQSTETFRRIGGPTVLVNILKDGFEDLEILNSGFAVVAASAAGNEVVKESYMELKIDELILEILNRQRNDNIQSLYDAIRALLTPDDNRVVASQVSVALTEHSFVSVTFQNHSQNSTGA